MPTVNNYKNAWSNGPPKSVGWSTDDPGQSSKAVTTQPASNTKQGGKARNQSTSRTRGGPSRSSSTSRMQPPVKPQDNQETGVNAKLLGYTPVNSTVAAGINPLHGTHGGGGSVTTRSYAAASRLYRAKSRTTASPLARQLWGQLCDGLNEQMSSKGTWHLLRHLLDPGTSKSSAQKQLQQLLHRYPGKDAELLDELALRYVCLASPDAPPENLPPYSGKPNPQLDEDNTEAEI
ncbi:hypothetical protein MTO96_026990 [Rhipicephalus appendiculatus]